MIHETAGFDTPFATNAQGYSTSEAWMNPNLTTLLTLTDRIMAGGNGWHADPNLILPSGVYQGRVHVGVDLGTAYTVLVVLDENFQPIAGEYQFAEVTRDGLVVDFIGAVDLLREMKSKVEKKLGFKLTSAATAYPPGVPQAEVRATANVLHGAELDCTGVIDEPTAANNVLKNPRRRNRGCGRRHDGHRHLPRWGGGVHSR